MSRIRPKPDMFVEGRFCSELVDLLVATALSRNSPKEFRSPNGLLRDSDFKKVDVLLPMPPRGEDKSLGASLGQAVDATMSGYNYDFPTALNALLVDLITKVQDDKAQGILPDQGKLAHTLEGSLNTLITENVPILRDVRKLEKRHL